MILTNPQKVLMMSFLNVVLYSMLADMSHMSIDLDVIEISVYWDSEQEIWKGKMYYKDEDN